MVAQNYWHSEKKAFLKMTPFKVAFKNTVKFRIALILPQSSPAYSARIHRRRLFSRARAQRQSIPNTVRALMESQMKCATPRNRSRSKGIDEAFSVTGALFRCIVTPEGAKDRGKGGRSLGYHAVERSIPTRVRIGSVMILKWKRSKRRWPRRGSSAIERRPSTSSLSDPPRGSYLLANCCNRLRWPATATRSDAPLPLGARKLASRRCKGGGRI